MTEETSHADFVPRRHAALSALLVAAGCLVPLALYWFLLGGSDCVTPEWARRQLWEQPQDFVLVDVRDKQAFTEEHLQAAVNWPLSDVLKAASARELSPAVLGKTPLFICDVGPESRRAARHIQSLGTEAKFVRGGLQEWVHSGRHEPPTPLDSWIAAGTTSEPVTENHDGLGGPPYVSPDRHNRPSPPYEQSLAVLAFFLLKPVSTVLALGIIIVLWTSRSPDLAALRWAMVFFFIAENSCAVNYLAFEERSYAMEFLHSIGMTLFMGFAGYALLDGLDRRVIMLSDARRRCAALGICGRCIKHADVPCGLRRLFCLLLPLAMLVSLFLPTAAWHDTVYATRIFGFPYVYGHFFAFQMFENWYCGGTALVLFAAALLTLLARKQAGIETAKILFAAGLGPLAFGGLRMFLGAAYDQHQVWYLFWEECTELALVVAACVVLWVFHRRLPLWINRMLASFNPETTAMAHAQPSPAPLALG